MSKTAKGKSNARSEPNKNLADEIPDKDEKSNDDDIRTTMGEKATPEQAEKAAAESICPCGNEVTTHKCRLCGAVKTINAVTGNVIWMRNGRVVKAFRDDKDAYIKMAIKHGIPRENWPKRFREEV